MLLLQCVANPAQLRRGIVVQAAIRLDLPIQPPQQVAQIAGQQRGRKLVNSRPLIPPRVRGRQDNLPPRLHSLRMNNQRPNLHRFKSRTFNPSLIEILRNVKNSKKVETSARNQLLHVSVALLLLFDPFGVRAGLQSFDPFLAQG